MKRKKIAALEQKLMDEISRRVRLGEYNADSATILLTLEVLHEVVRHMRENHAPDESAD